MEVYKLSDLIQEVNMMLMLISLQNNKGIKNGLDKKIIRIKILDLLTKILDNITDMRSRLMY